MHHGLCRYVLEERRNSLIPVSRYKKEYVKMENSISISVSPLQALLALAFQIWIVVFPIILIRKLNYLTAIIASQKCYEDETEDSGPR